MSYRKKYSGEEKVIVIGGSAGSIPVLCNLLKSLPENFNPPIIVCLHRMKNIAEGMVELFSKACTHKVIEPNDKEEIKLGKIYLAPSNYYLLIEDNYTFSLSTDVLENYSRPSIDVTLQSCSKVFKDNLIGILLTGANKDGVEGMCSIKKRNGITIVQNPNECIAPFMPQAAIDKKCIDFIYSTEEIKTFLNNLAFK